MAALLCCMLHLVVTGQVALVGAANLQNFIFSPQGVHGAVAAHVHTANVNAGTAWASRW